MAYITREDGIHFVIPSYRDVLIAKKHLIQKEVVSLSHNYGEYITMQRKASDQYEVAFSPDTGYLLGETVWQHFHRPLDMIYCEAIPNTTEAILVIVKNGSVYLDGSFPSESVPEELVIFLTQKNNFEIYIYGDVPVSESPAEGKFSFDAAAVKSFKVLDEPVFNKLPLLAQYQLKLFDIVLKDNGIGVFPVEQLLIVVGAIVLISFLGYKLVTYEPPKREVVVAPNPYQGYVDAMASPDPYEAMAEFVDKLKLFYAIPGWKFTSIKYSGGGIDALMKSDGSSIESLMAWAGDHDATVAIIPTGVVLSMPVTIPSRAKPREIYPARDILAKLLDDLVKVYPGNMVSLSTGQGSPAFNTYTITIRVVDQSFMGLMLIEQQLKNLPLVLDEISLNSSSELLNGQIVLRTMGK